MKKILIVDDSIVYRHALNSALSENRNLMIVGSAKNGQEAIDFITKNQVDLITLDIEMPIMDGFKVLEIISHLPTKPRVIVFTSLDSRGADNAMRALHAGADDFLTKLEGTSDVNKNIAEIKDALIPKIESLLKLESVSAATQNMTYISNLVDSKPKNLVKSYRPIKDNYDYIFIGSSTGGPEALRTLFSNLKGSKMPPIFIVQHMPPLYTSMLAKTLQESTSYKVIEGKNGDHVQPGYCYIAPGDYHMEIKNLDNQLTIVLHKKEKECFVRPSVNYLFRSSKELTDKSLYIILTGMGNDGLEGVNYIKVNDPDILIQDEATSVVWGMPGEIFKLNLETQIKSINGIKDILVKIIK